MTEWQDSHSARPRDAPKGWRTGRYAMTEWQDSHSARPRDAPKGWRTGRYAMTTARCDAQQIFG